MGYKSISIALYAAYLTNKYGYLMRNARSHDEIMRLRLEYSKTLFSRLNINVAVLNKDKIPGNGQYLLISNHRSIIDPVIIDLALEGSTIAGCWVAKKELYNSFFFGLFVRNSGAILIDREAENMGPFFKETKKLVKNGKSIYIFPEGTRNKENTLLSEFKEGSRIIALKNRLPMLPVYIKTNSDAVLSEAVHKRTKNLTIEIEIGDPIDYKTKTPLGNSYKSAFNLDVCAATEFA